MPSTQQTAHPETDLAPEITTKHGLRIYYDLNNDYEIGIDEAGRGPMFGPVYAAAVVLPKTKAAFDHEELRDSKKFTSKKKIGRLADHIKTNAVAYAVCSQDHLAIDKLNIRQATLKAMHQCVESVLKQLVEKGHIPHRHDWARLKLLVDGNDFKPFMGVNPLTGEYHQLSHTTFEGGDNRYTPIAAASILAKTERDSYIEELCQSHPYLVERYSIDTNKGYGTAKHLEGIRNHGISRWHRLSYGICKSFARPPISP